MPRHIHVHMSCRKCDSSICPNSQEPRPGDQTSLSHGEREWCLVSCSGHSACSDLVPYWITLKSFFPILALPPDSSRPHPFTAGASLGKHAGFSCSCSPPSLPLLHWPALFAAQGHEEDILPILQSLSLIEMGSKTRLQKKSLLWAALLEENESPKQIGFCDLRQTSLFILHNPV